MCLLFDQSDILWKKTIKEGSKVSTSQQREYQCTKINQSACRETVVLSSPYISLLSLKKKSAEQLKDFVIMIYV